MSFLKKLFGDDASRELTGLQEKVAQINALEPSFEALSDEALKAKTGEFKSRLERGESLDDILPEAFAVVREVSRRKHGERHYDVQLMGGILLHQGKIPEMRTGEGKTLVATLPAYLNALMGKGVHIVTVNDYLARRDAVWMGEIYDSLGLSVGVINHSVSYLYDATHTEKDKERDAEGSYHVVYEFLRPTDRASAYRSDITYGTNNEFGFDYLRDNLSYNTGNVVQRMNSQTNKFHFAIIDEVDSILIDEARTPLIISAPAGESESLYGTFAKISAQLEEEKDYTVDHKMKAVSLTDEGITRVEELLGVSNIYTEKGIKYVHHLETAVKARAIYHKDKEYVIRNGEVVIVDEFTGRLQPGRRWSEGLHQAIEAKEGVRIQEESRTFATVTLQNYFRLYEKLSGMTGTAQTSAEEFRKVYGLLVVPVPPHRESKRADLPDLIFQTERGKFQAIAKDIRKRYDKGQPVLVGTVSIEKNELLSAHLTREGIPHEVLNAKNHEREGEIIAGAGRKSSVIVATNMAGRGVDIKLGGPQSTPEEHDEIKALGGLVVIGTERHEARRIDNQLRGRAGRQGDPGETQFFLSLEDTLMRVFGSDRIKGMMGRFGIPEDEPIISGMVSKAIENAQTKIEGLNFDARKHLLEYDDVVNHQRITVYNRRRKVLFGAEAEALEFLGRAKETLTVSAEEEAEIDQTITRKREELQDKFIPSLRQLILQVIDMYWVEHLEAIDYMRSSVRLRAYGQRDPLVEFKREGLDLFKQMEKNVFNQVLNLLATMGTEFKQEAIAMEEVKEGAIDLSSGSDRGNHIANDGQKIGRNDPCPCGSGKKWKQCGLINTAEHQKLMSGK